MCGLAGILLYPTERSEGDWQKIRHLFTQTLIFNQERGRDASGLAMVWRDGAFVLFKQPVPACELVEMEQYQDILDAIGPETVCLLGHTRFPTKGSRWNNDNNHPVLGVHTLGVHNGTIHNDDELFAALHLPRRGEVDSEIIFRLLDTIDPLSLNGRYLTAVREKAGLLEGKLASLYVDLRRPTRLVALKRDNPLCLHYEAPLKALFFSSRYLFLRQAFGRAVVTEALPSQHVYLFDAEQLPEQRTQPISSLPL